MENEFSASKLANHRGRVNELIEGKDVFPVTVEMNITNLCNFDCPWCSEDEFRRRHAGATIPWQIVVQAMKDMKRLGVQSVTLEGGGEPTVHPHFKDIVLADHVGLDIGLITNGSTLLTFSQELIERFVYIRVSLDAGDAETHAKMHSRETDIYNRILAGIERVAKLKMPKEVLGISYIVTPETIPGMVQATKIARLIGADYIQFKPLLGHDGTIKYFEMGDVLEEVKEQDSPPHFRVYLSRFGKDEIGKPVGVRNYKHCRSHRLIGAIASNGDVMLCCNLKHRYDREFSFGNLRFQSFEDIWRSERRHRIINRVESDERFLKDICIYCRMNSFNEIIEGSLTDLNPLWRVI